MSGPAGPAESRRPDRQFAGAVTLAAERHGDRLRRGLVSTLNRAMIDGAVEIPIAEVFRLEDAARAHERLERGHVLGKIVLEISD